MIHDTIKQRLRATLLLTPLPKVTQALALRHAAGLGEDGTWGDLPSPASSLPPSGRSAHLERTLLLAKALRAAGGALDDPLRRAFDLWLAHDFTAPDWRDHQITIPRLIGEIALLYDSGLSAGAGGKVMEILARSRWADWVPSFGWVDRAGMDLLGIAYNLILRGCLENAPSFFDAAFGRIFREIRLVQPGEEGIQADMTFRSPTPNRAGGGLGFLRECAQFIALAHGTPWQAPTDTVKLFAGFLLDGQQWMMRQETVDADEVDEMVAQQGGLEGVAAVIQQLAQLGNPPRRLELAAFAHRLQGRGEALSGHRYFWRARMAVHQRPAFYASLRLWSSPVADGRAIILRSGHEYRDLDPAISVDTTPGTTTHLGAVAPALENLADDGPAQLPRFLSGGVSEGDCGLAVTELQRPGLTARKAWFFFDESLVCLGADLRGILADQSVRTTINHCRLQGTVTAHLRDGETRQLASAQEHMLGAVRTVEHDGISYVFPAPAAVCVRVGCADAGKAADPATATAFCLQIDHGSQPRSASWAYIALPTTDDSELDARVADEASRIDILANNSSLQAVQHRGSGLLGVAFWVPGVVLLPGGGRVAANHPCLLLCREEPTGGTRLSISNLSDRAAAVHVEYGGQCVCFELPGGPDAGRSISRLL